MTEERRRRAQPESKAKTALAKLAALKQSGGRRIDSYETEEEQALYDVVDQDEYAELVQKRRETAGWCDQCCTL